MVSLSDIREPLVFMNGLTTSSFLENVLDLSVGANRRAIFRVADGPCVWIISLGNIYDVSLFPKGISFVVRKLRSSFLENMYLVLLDH